VQRLRSATHEAREDPAGLREHCAAFCRALTIHHTSEDTHAFPLLAAEAPELRPVLAKLAEDHVLIAGLLQQVEELVVRLPAAPSPEELRRFEQALDGIAAIMESHFSFEERRILDALDELNPEAHSGVELFGIATG
jgi:iron-sulfur cluster repair protein YtfE (RIC family)